MVLANLLWLLLEPPGAGDAAPAAEVEWVTGERWADIRPRHSIAPTGPPVYLD